MVFKAWVLKHYFNGSIEIKWQQKCSPWNCHLFFARHSAWIHILYLFYFALIMITYTFAYHHARHRGGVPFILMNGRMAECSWAWWPREPKGVMDSGDIDKCLPKGSWPPGERQERCLGHTILCSLPWVTTSTETGTKESQLNCVGITKRHFQYDRWVQTGFSLLLSLLWKICILFFVLPPDFSCSCRWTSMW